MADSPSSGYAECAILQRHQFHVQRALTGQGKLVLGGSPLIMKRARSAAGGAFAPIESRSHRPEQQADEKA